MNWIYFFSETDSTSSIKNAMEFFTNPWVIGIGTAVIAGLILHFGFGVGRRKSRPPESTTQPTTAVQDKNHLDPPLRAQEATRDITPHDIGHYLDSLPPLQRDSAAENYKGIRVSWKVNLKSAITLSDGKLLLHMSIPEKFPFPAVNCTVDPDQYPLLRVIKETQTFTVEGEIQEVKPIAIKLKNCLLFF